MSPNIRVFRSAGTLRGEAQLNQHRDKFHLVSEHLRLTNALAPNERNPVLVVMKDREPVAYASTTLLDDGAVRLDLIEVAEGMRRRGVGTALLRRVEQLAGPQSSIVLNALPSATGFYMKQGFSRKGARFSKRRP